MAGSRRETELTLRIVVADPPPGVTIQLQRGRDGLAPPSKKTTRALTFEFPVRVGERPDGEPNFLGPYTQGPPAARFVYVNSGTLAGQPDTCWTRRAKVPLTTITWPLIGRAQKDGAVLETTIEGRGRDGGPSCGTVPLRDGWHVAENRGR